MIYLASPYTHDDPAIQANRFSRAYHYVTIQMKMGAIIFSPIVYGHQFHKNGDMPGDFKTWIDFNNHMLISSDALHILTLPGWTESKGVQQEIDLAATYDIPTREVRPL